MKNCLVAELQATSGPRRRRRRRRRRPHTILSIRLSQILPCSSHVDYCLHPSKQHPPLFSRCSKVLSTAEGSRHSFLFLSKLEKSSVRDTASRAQEIIQLACLLACFHLWDDFLYAAVEVIFFKPRESEGGTWVQCIFSIFESLQPGKTAFMQIAIHLDITIRSRLISGVELLYNAVQIPGLIVRFAFNLCT